jgi:tetratricopeptide (TPR) repeat protein
MNKPDALEDAAMFEAILSDLKRQLEALPSRERLNDAQVEGLYALGYREFGRSRYAQALDYFKVALLYRPTSPTYLRAAALCLQRLRNYELAVAAYAALQFLEPNEPAHALAIAECRLLRREHAMAREMLERAVSLSGSDGRHAAVRARAHSILELMRSHDVPTPA